LQWLRQRMRVQQLDPVVTHALRSLAEQPQVQRIAQLARDTGLSERRLGLLFQRQVGMRPKHYARLLRFRAVVAQTHGPQSVNWSHVAADCGYCDQAHLSHEFRRFAGVTPSAFMAARGPHINHLPLA
jgi:AraC-like DNA-binding protein